MLKSRYLLTGLCALALTITGCDSSTTDADDAGLPDGLSTTEDAAAVIAGAVALQSGGALDDVANLAAELGDFSGARLSGEAHPAGCEGERAFDEATGVWTRSLACERGRPDGLFYAAFSRTQTFAFFDADGNSVMLPADAASLDFAIVDGTGIRRTPRAHHELLDLSADLAVTGIGDGDSLVTVNGTYSRSATDTLTTRNATRTFTYALDLTLDDVTGPARRRHDDPAGAPGRPGPAGTHWGRPVSGTLSGSMTGQATYSGPRGDFQREVDRTFTVTFGGDSASPTARIRFDDGSTYTADALTGELQ